MPNDIYDNFPCVIFSSMILPKGGILVLKERFQRLGLSGIEFEKYC